MSAPQPSRPPDRKTAPRSGPCLPDDFPHGPKTLSRGRRLLFWVIMALATLATIEGGLRVIYALKDKGPVTPRQKAAKNPVYAELDWPREMFAEEDRLKQGFVPFIMWRTQEFHGKHINISPGGLRKTWNPTLQGNEKVKRVFCFGGSTTWGVGARDDFTLPSLLSKKLNQGATRYVVENYGEKGFCLTQEVISLVLLLKQGNIPDYVIFYDGINEVMVGVKNGEPGSVFGAEIIRRQLFRREKETFWRKIGNELGRTRIHRAVTDLSRVVRPQPGGQGGSPQEEENRLNRLADAIVQDYLKNIEVVQRLAQAYGFKYLFVWQPSPCTSKSLTAEEKNLVEAWEEQEMVKMYRLVYDRMRPVRLNHFHNFADMFDQKTESVFISWAHLTEKGNAWVAERLCKIFQQEFAEAPGR
jgi:lysophospholipase L1-like esterase